MAIGRNRSDRVGGAPADAFLKQGLSEDQVRAIINDASDTDAPTTTLSGVPQPVLFPNPPGYVFASRVGSDGLIYPSVRFTSLASTLRRFRIWHRRVRRNGLYGMAFDQVVRPTAANIAANSIEVEIDEGLPPGFEHHLVLIESKHTVAVTDDGGNADQSPLNYVSLTAPNASQPALAIFTAGRGQPGYQVQNFCQNAKFKWSSLDWMDDNGSTDHAPPLTDAMCAKWRYALDQSRGLSTVVANGNYWSTGPPFAGQMTMRSSNALFDPCSRMEGAPYNNGETFNVAFTGIEGGAWTINDNDVILTITLHDEGLGFLEVARTQMAVGAVMSRTEWLFVQMPNVLCNWGAQTPTGRQWVRWHLSNDLSTGKNMHVDKVLYSDQQGGFSQHAKDLSQLNPPSTTSSSASGLAGAGVQPGNFPFGVGGAYIPVTD